jgi:glycosyltransferase involved in cell wall biosynthesis
MFGWEFPPHISGGLGTACYGITKGLLQNDVEVVFVVPKAFGDEDTEQIRLVSASDTTLKEFASEFNTTTEYLSEKFTYFGLHSGLVPYLNVEQFEHFAADYTDEQTIVHTIKAEKPIYAHYEFSGKYGKNLLEEVWNYAIISSQITRDQEFDVIHAHDWLSFPAGLVAKQISGKPFVAHVHATEFDRSGEHVNQQIYDIERKGMEAADKVIAVSEFTKQILIHRYGIPSTKIEVVHNGVEARPEKKETDAGTHAFPEKIITYLGRVTFQKGPEYFVEAAAKVLEKDKNFRFVMAGNGDMLVRMIKKVAQMRISSHFHFTGFLRGSDVDKMFAMSDVYVMPSVSEPFGISPLEAIKSDVPVIISNQSGVKEVLKHAMKVDFWDTDAMANAIFALAKFDSLSELFRRESKKEMEQLKWIVQTKKMKSIYQQITNNK